MEYLKKKFSVGMSGKEYGEGWDRTFGKKPPATCEKCGGTGTVEEDATGALGYVVNRPCPCACHAASTEHADPR